MAASISRSPTSEPRRCCDSAKPATGALPRPENSQKAGFGRLAAAQHAEDRGRQRQQADEDDRMRRGDVLERQRRQQRKADDHAERRRWPARPDRCARAASGAAAESRLAPSSAAITARAEVRNSGEKPPTATRVAGSEPLKMMTPRRPLPQPSVARFMLPLCLAVDA